MRFLDEVEIHVQAGNGGNGCTSFLREKYRPRGGPDGGDGGKGGDVILVANGKHTTLLDLHVKRYYKAESGKNGGGKNQHGRKGRDVTIHVPVGSLIRDAETLVVLRDLCINGEQFTVVRGGSGGRGNARFVTPTQKAPDFAEKGKPGEEKRLRLELKLIADVGIIGFPNAGKSTLIARVSSAHPKVADYPFTTLVPNLGVVPYREHSSFVLADIPGIIEGASCGHGLGLRFLRHIERAFILLFLIDLVDPERSDPLEAFAALKNELKQFDRDLLKKQQVIAFNKIDIPEAQESVSSIQERMETLPLPVFFVSALTGEQVTDLIRYLGDTVEESKNKTEATF
jgi:GTPase